MKNKILKSILWFYLKIIRIWLSPLLYWYYNKDKTFTNEWNKIRDYDEDVFSKVLAEYDYYSDPLGGGVDFSPLNKNYFFHNKKESRDCDDWARMWYWYWQYRNVEVYEIALLDLDNLSTSNIPAHMVTVVKIDGKYQLFDYRPVEEKGITIDKVLQYNNVGYDSFIWVINK